MPIITIYNVLKVTFSMIEIYNEVIRDLLNLKGLNDRKGAFSFSINRF